ncbi:MAG: PLD nuclease N-terminal domain-containing protein [Cellulomonas sp.]
MGKRQMAKQQWSDLSPRKKTMARVTSLVQVALALAAWFDLATRPAERVNGRKAVWALVIGINFVGPIAYFAKGRGAQG